MRNWISVISVALIILYSCGNKSNTQLVNSTLIQPKEKLYSELNTKHSATKIWIDTDLMIGKPGLKASEVDDGLALILALKQPKLKIVGISNITNVDYGEKTIHKILDWHKPNHAIPVYRGSENADDLGVENDATKAMYNALQKEKLTILALGPVTNVATVLQNHPEIAANIEQIVLCASRTPNLPFNPGNGRLNVYDYNYELDTESMDVLLKTNVKLLFAGYEPSAYTFIGPKDLEGLNTNLEADEWFLEAITPWMNMNEILFGVNGFVPYDCITLGVLTHPEYFTYYEDIPIQVNERENDSKLVQVSISDKKYLEVSYDYESNRKVLYTKKTLHGFEEIILESLSAEPMNN